jgi:hypothetical protein
LFLSPGEAIKNYHSKQLSKIHKRVCGFRVSNAWTRETPKGFGTIRKKAEKNLPDGGANAEKTALLDHRQPFIFSDAAGEKTQ